jgi:hypothetical protein
MIDDDDDGSNSNSRPSATITLSHKSISLRVGSVWKGKSGMVSANYLLKTDKFLEDDLVTYIT